MSKRPLGIIGIVVLVLLAFPRGGTAGIIDTIFEMSGPQLIGVVIGCKVELNADLSNECSIVGWPTERSAGVPRAWLSVEGGIYTSTGKNSEGTNYEAFRTNMLAFEPILEVRSTNLNGFVVYHGVAGLSYDFFFGPDFRRFDKFGAKFRPIGVAFNTGRFRWDLAYNLRLYGNGFTADEFGFGRRMDGDRPSEAVHGVSIGLLFRR